VGTPRYNGRMVWVLLVLLYGILKGSREVAKKKAMMKNTVMEVLVVYTFISFLFVIPQVPDAGGLEPEFYFWIALKSFAIFVAWICGFYSLKYLPISLYGVLDLSRVLFMTFLGVVFLHEVLNVYQVIGLVTVITGLLMLKFNPGKKNRQENVKAVSENPVMESARINTPFYVVLAFVSCILNAVSGFMDKVLMKSVTSSQLQFWYMLFLALYYLIYILIKKERISLSVLKNVFVWIMAVMFVIGDKALFIANGMSESKVTVMTLVKQSGVIFAILGGKFVFKEKGILYKMICALIIIAGISVGVIFNV